MFYRGINPGSCQKEELALFAELKPRLSVVHAVLHVPKSQYEKGTTVKVLKSHIDVVQKDASDVESNSKHQTVVLEDVALIPASCHSLRWVPGDGMHFRMQICHQGCDTENLENLDVKAQTKPEEILSPYRSAPTILCRMCGQLILQKKSFSRVLSLPSDDWHEMADQLYCHPHADDVPPADCLAPRPGPGDCFVSARHLLLAREELLQNPTSPADPSAGVVEATNGALHCTRCKVILGHRKDFSKTACVQFSTDYLIVKNDMRTSQNIEKNCRRDRVESWFADFLLTETTTHSSCRLLIESDMDGKKSSPYILLWVLESNVVLYSGKIQSNDQAECRLSPQPILKVLYRDCLREKNQRLGKQWREDFTVHSLTLPHDLCRQLLLTLVHSSEQLPRSLQAANGFYVGFLRKTPLD